MSIPAQDAQDRIQQAGFRGDVHGAQSPRIQQTRPFPRRAAVGEQEVNHAKLDFYVLYAVELGHGDAVRVRGGTNLDFAASAAAATA